MNASNDSPSPSTKVALTNVRVFDGNQIHDACTIVIDGDVISDDSTDATILDGQGGVLLPGFIDAHVHVHDAADLTALSQHGITTALDMGNRSREIFAGGSLRGVAGIADIRTAGIPATSTGSRHSKIPGFPQDALLSGPMDADQYVKNRIADGADYIKVLVDVPGPDQATVNALVAQARQHGKLCIAHAMSNEPFKMAQRAGVPMITHVPLDKALDGKTVAGMKSGSQIAIPTLVKMLGTAKLRRNETDDYAEANDSVAALHRAEVPILAGTDANKKQSGPHKVSYGDSIHDEMELLVAAGLSTVAALQAATSLPARYFGLRDRGVIEVGKRADLILLSEDPIKDIRATRSIQHVWCAGVECSTT